MAIGLFEANNPLVTSKAVNPGFGNMIASMASTANLASSAVAKFNLHMGTWIRGVSLREPRYGDAGPPRPPGSKGSGTGFYVSGDGLVMTAFHGIEGATRILIKRPGEAPIVAQVVKLDRQDDLAGGGNRRGGGVDDGMADASGTHFDMSV